MAIQELARSGHAVIGRFFFQAEDGIRDLRVRLPRGQSLDAQRAARGARLGEGSGRRKGQGPAATSARLRAGQWTGPGALVSASFVRPRVTFLLTPFS